MGVFGWSLPPGCGALPEEEDEEESIQPRCWHCGAFLPWSPDEEKPWEVWLHVPALDGSNKAYAWMAGPFRGEGSERQYLAAAGVEGIWTCRRCHQAQSVFS